MPLNVAFVTNICPHYRIKTFETLAKYYDTNYYFFSAGNEWYWQQQHGVNIGNFNYEYCPGFQIGNARITPSLVSKLVQKNYDLYIKCINGRFALPATYMISKAKRKPFILWTGVWNRVETPIHKIAFPATRHIYQNADAIVVYGKHVKRYLISEGVAKERIFVTTHAVNNEAYNFEVPSDEILNLRQRLRIQPHEKVVLYLGRLEKGKGLEHLVKGFAALNQKDAVLVLAGTGSEEIMLKRLVQETKIEKQVRFPGYISTDNTVPYYAMAWVYVLPSVTTKTFKEPWGLVVNEAFNQGTPVIATDAVGAAAGGLIQDGINGFVVPEGSDEMIAGALQKVLQNPQLRNQLSVNATQTIASWNNETMIDGFRAAIDYVTNTNN